MSSGNSSSTVSVSISALLKKTEHYDKDERYMATSDLCEVLKRHSAGDTSQRITMDASTERRICTAVLRLLHDKSNDVQAIAVKTLSVLLTTVKQEQVLEIAESLGDQVLDASKSELRDVYAIGLRTLVKTIPPSMGNRVSQRLVVRLLEGIRSSQNQEIILACLDILTDLLGRFGATALSVTRQHGEILQMCLTQLSSDSPVVRKRAGSTIGCLSVVLSDALLMRMVEALLSQIDMAEGVGKQGKKKTAEAQQQQKQGGGGASGGGGGVVAVATPNVGDTRALIRTMCTVSGAVGHRLGQAQIDRILPIFLRFTDPEDAITGDDDDIDEYHDMNDDQMNDGADSNDDFNMNETEDEAAMLLANELRESCFSGFESFILRCPTEVDPHLDKIIQAALAYMSYDPNYSYGHTDDDFDEDGNGDDDDDDFEVEDDEDDDDDFDEEDDDEDDDDDESWKVRRSAIRALKAVVEAKKHDPSTLWTKSYSVRKEKSAIVAAALVGRFKEREENCRVGVIDCFTRLLDVTVVSASAGVVAFTSSPDDMDVSSGVSIDLRTKYAPSLVAACEKLLSVKKGGERSKSNALTLLSTLCKAPGGVGGQQEILSVFKHVQTFLASSDDFALHRDVSSKALRLDALSLVHAMLACDNHEPIHIQQGLRQTLLPELCRSVQEQWYKVIAEALRALAAVPRFFTTQLYVANNVDADTRKKEMDEVAGLLYAAVEPLLAAHDVDQEIKECALKACASLLSSLHNNLTTEQRNRLLSLLLERLKNETTRISAIKTLSSIAAAASEATTTTTTTTEIMSDNVSGGGDDNNKIDLSPILVDSISTMASFLKLQSRSLKQHSLEALDIIITSHGAMTANNSSSSSSSSSSSIDDLYAMVLQELAPLVVETDLHLSHLSLRASISVLKQCPSCGPAAKVHVLPNALVLSTSSLLQDLALDSLLALLEQIVISNAVDFPEMLSMLRQRLTTEDKMGKHSISNLAMCIAIVTATTTPDNRLGVINDTLTLLEGSKTPNDASASRQVQLALLVSGGLCRRVDLSTLEGVTEKFLTIYMGYLESPSEDLKQAAAHSLGRASVGAQNVFLPAIVRTLDENNQKKQYLLLSALREFIKSTQEDGVGVANSLPVILPHLEKHCKDSEEGVRTMVAECLGSLTCLQPDAMFKKLEEMQNAHSNIKAPGGTVAAEDTQSKENALVCWTIATSIKAAIANKVDPAQLSTYMPGLLQLLKQEELSVRNAALLMVYSAVHHMPQVVSGLMKDSITPSLYEVAELKLERSVNLGPFTHVVDDALPLRKASLSIFATCLENLPASLDIAAFMPVLAKALGDKEDIQLHAHHIVLSMCVRQPTYLVGACETFVEPLEKTIHKKPGQKTGTELERLNDWIKSALRVMIALSKLEGSLNVRKYTDFVQRTRENAKFRPQIEALEDER